MPQYTVLGLGSVAHVWRRFRRRLVGAQGATPEGDHPARPTLDDLGTASAGALELPAEPRGEPAALAVSTSASTKNKLAMLAATVVRLGFGVATFVLLARFLGPSPFGLIATVMAYSAFVGVATDYGMTTSSLRKAAASPERTRDIMADTLAVKAVLTTAVTIVGAIALSLSTSPATVHVYGLVFAGALAHSAGDLAIVGARANGRFDIEASLTLGTSATMFALVGGVAAVTNSVMAVAATFALTRVGCLIVIVWTVRRWLGNPFVRSFSQILGAVRSSSVYAFDNLLTTLLSQIDILIFAAILSTYEIGLYQAGARLVQVIIPVAVILSTVYLPQLSNAISRKDKLTFASAARRLNIEFMVLAVLSGIGFWQIGPIATDIFYGADYELLVTLWPGFGAYAFIRLMTAAFAIQLAAAGRIRTRIIGQFMSIGLMGAAGVVILPTFGLGATSWLAAISCLPALILFAFAARHAASGLAVRTVRPERNSRT